MGDEDPDAAVLLASLNEPARFATVFEQRVDGIYRYLVLRTGQSVAEELTAETFARAFAGRHRFDPSRGTVRAWLYGIAANLARHHRRDEQRHLARLAALGPDELVTPDGSGQLADRMRLAGALASLQPRQRHVVVLLGLGDLSYDEAAVVLSVPVGTVRSSYSRARAQLVQLLAESDMI